MLRALRRLSLAALLSLVAQFANPSAFDYINNAVTVVGTPQLLTCFTDNRPGHSIIVYNPSASGATVYAKFFRSGETVVPAAATATGGIQIDAGAQFVRANNRDEGGGGYVSVSLVAAAGQTASNVKVWGMAR